MKSLLREPLVHFLLIGAALFVIFSFINNPPGKGSDRIIITPGQIEFLKANFTRTWQRPPSEKELQGLVDSHIREEIFYREALALGLDKDDATIRRRLMLKLETLSNDLAEAAAPSDEDLKSFLKANPERFRIEPQMAFSHVFINTDQRRRTAMDEAERLLAVLSDEKNADLDTLGDTVMLPKSFGLTRAGEISRLFGDAFTRELVTIIPGQWAGPIRSGYGLHLVKVTNTVAERLPELDEVREVVEREWFAVHRKEMQEGIYKRLRERYTVVFEQPASEKKHLQTVSVAQAAQEKQQ